MRVLEYKIKGKKSQYQAIDEVILTTQFVRNKALRHWMDAPRELKIDRFALNRYSTELRNEFGFVKDLNSMAVQSAAERAWVSISRFYDNCKSGKPGKKAHESAVRLCLPQNSRKGGFPKFRKHRTNLSVEYKTCGWKLSNDRLTITFTDGFEAGAFRLWGTRDRLGKSPSAGGPCYRGFPLHFYQIEQIKRVRVVRPC